MNIRFYCITNADRTLHFPYTPANASFPGTAITAIADIGAINPRVIKEDSAKPRIKALLIASGLISTAVSIFLLTITLSAHAQEYCPSGAVVTAQSQCPGAVGPVDNLTKSILRLNNSGVNNPNETSIKVQTNNTKIGDQLENQTAAQNTTIGSFSTYENPTYGIRMAYPSSWEIRPPSSMLQVANKIVEFVLPSNKLDPNGSLDGDLSLSVESVSKFLDTNTMKVKSHALQDYVNGKISTINSMHKGQARQDVEPVLLQRRDRGARARIGALVPGVARLRAHPDGHRQLLPDCSSPRVSRSTWSAPR